MGMIVQFQGPEGPIFVHRESIVSVRGMPQRVLLGGKRVGVTVLTLEGGATVEVVDAAAHAAEKWEQAFEEDFDEYEDLEDALVAKNIDRAETNLFLAMRAVEAFGEDVDDDAVAAPQELQDTVEEALVAWYAAVGERFAEVDEDDENEGEGEDDDADA